MSRFSLRDLFWLTLVAGLVLGWWVHVRRLADPEELFTDGFQQGIQSNMDWWKEKAASVDDPELRKRLQEYVDEQPQGGSFTIRLPSGEKIRGGMGWVY